MLAQRSFLISVLDLPPRLRQQGRRPFFVAQTPLLSRKGNLLSYTAVNSKKFLEQNRVWRDVQDAGFIGPMEHPCIGSFRHRLCLFIEFRADRASACATVDG